LHRLGQSERKGLQRFTVWDSNDLKLKWTSNLRLGRKKILGFRALPKTTWPIQKRKGVKLATLHYVGFKRFKIKMDFKPSVGPQKNSWLSSPTQNHMENPKQKK